MKKESIIVKSLKFIQQQSVHSKPLPPLQNITIPETYAHSFIDSSGAHHIPSRRSIGQFKIIYQTITASPRILAIHANANASTTARTRAKNLTSTDTKTAPSNSVFRQFPIDEKLSTAEWNDRRGWR